jgi:hypothetical protein
MPVRHVVAANVNKMIIPTHGALHEVRKLFEMRDVGVFHSTMKVGCNLPHEVHGCDEIIFRIKGGSGDTSFRCK